MPISVVIAEDHLLLRRGLVLLLGQEPGIRVVDEVGDGMGAVEAVHRASPDILVVGCELPLLNGVGVVRNVRSAGSSVGVVAISNNSSEKTALEMLEAGTRGYLTPSSSPTELIEAVRQVHSGHTYLSPTIAGPVLRRFLEGPDQPQDSTSTGLSRREQEVLQLIAEGKSSKDIAAVLGISLNTVIRHRQNITDKLGLSGVAELTRYAIREGLVKLD